VGAAPFATALEAMLAPLRFEARDGGAFAGRVRDLEAGMRETCAAALVLRIPRDARAAIELVASSFEETLDAASRARAVAASRERLAPFAAPGFAEAALARSVTALAGIGPKRAATLEKRGLATVADLLFRLPSRYDDRRNLVRIADLEVGRRATFAAQVRTAEMAPSRGRSGRFRRVLHALVSDETGSIELKWFHGGDAIQPMLTKGRSVLVTGDVRRYRFSKELMHPDVEPLDDVAPDAETSPAAVAALRQIVPEYTAPEGVPPRAIRRLVQNAVAAYADLVVGHLPATVVRARKLPGAAEALAEIHFPSPDADPEALLQRTTLAHQRLVLEELYLLELGLALRRERREREPGVVIASGPRASAAPDGLPFRLTRAQRRVVGEIQADLAQPHPMNRLLQGDVGSGKTAVAFLAAIAAAEAGHQVAMMAPTELLAEQHERSLHRLAAAGGDATSLRIALLTASVPRADAKATRGALAAGAIDLVVGTHALVQEDVRFASLALAVIDEQHRFGVLQRQALAGKGPDERSPHVLVMTATPIPRTLALTLAGELDVSVLDEMPPGRRPVATDVLREGEGARAVEAIRRALARREQVYVVYPLVEESEQTDLRAATEMSQRIARAFPDARVDLVHGRLDAVARGEVMARFERNETQILVSTTVIEVGVDVPNATLMVVEHAERFGLAQLHQLRGRVGRGERPGTCLLVARGSTADSEARLRALLESGDGFVIAEADLRIRGPGEFLGTRQHGRLPDLLIADLVRDARLLPVASQAALETVRKDPRLARDAELLRAVQRRWGAKLALANVG
jgi:ATP-dependent DNA helicase RecG